MLEARFGFSATGINRTAGTTSYPDPGVVDAFQVQADLGASACLRRRRRNFPVAVGTDGAAAFYDGFVMSSDGNPA